MEMGKLIDLYVTSRNGIPVIRIIICNLRLSIYLSSNMASKDVFLVSGGYDGVIRCWDTSGGHAKKTLEYKDSQDAKTKYV